MEELIWNTITDSAKGKFDFEGFEKPFIEFDENLPGIVLFKIIIELANKSESKIISAKIFNDLILSGFDTDKKDLDVLIEELADKLKVEIYATQLAFGMLNDGTSETSTLKAINQFLR